MCIKKRKHIYIQNDGFIHCKERRIERDDVFSLYTKAVVRRKGIFKSRGSLSDGIVSFFFVYQSFLISKDQFHSTWTTPSSSTNLLYIIDVDN